MGKKKIQSRHPSVSPPPFPVYLQPSRSHLTEFVHGSSTVSGKGQGKTQCEFTFSECILGPCTKIVTLWPLPCLATSAKLSTLPQFPHLGIAKFCISSSMVSPSTLWEATWAFFCRISHRGSHRFALCHLPSQLWIFSFPLSAPQCSSCQPETQHTLCSLFCVSNSYILRHSEKLCNAANKHCNRVLKASSIAINWVKRKQIMTLLS